MNSPSPKTKEVGVHCLQCAIELKQAIIKNEVEEVPEPMREVPNPRLAFTWQVMDIKGIPVTIPVCLYHLILPNKSGLAVG